MLGALYDLAAIGRPYTDIIVHVSDDMIRNYGFPKGKVREIQPSLMDALRSDLTDYAIYPGGSPPNTCADIAAFGGKAVFIGKVCDDNSGRAFRKGFAPLTNAGGVIFETANHPASRREISATCVVLITSDHVATVVHCSGVSDILTEDDIPEPLIQNSKILYFQAHFFFVDTARDAILKAMGIAKSARRNIAISMHDHHMTAAQAEYFRENYLQDVDIIVGNLGEYSLAFPDFDPANFVSDNRLMVVTDGARGAHIVGRRENIHIPPHLLKARDNTVGAGDAFAAGFFFGYGHGLPLQTCGEFGAEAASAILDIPGARPVSSWKEMANRYLSNAPASLRTEQIK